MDGDMYTMPTLGERFPALSVNTTQGMMHLPDDLEGEWFVLFSHPADFTPVCTTEFVAFQKRIDRFREMNCRLIGMSVDQVFSHIKWVQWIKEKLNVEIEFPVVAATEDIALRLGMMHPGKGANTVRAVFVVDGEGMVRTILYYPQEVGRNIDEIVRTVRALQTSDAQGALPANWPDNELIGDRVIVPPAKDVKSAEENAGQFEHYDWWFCHKPLQD
ncbi:peroxiredoxin [Kiritimatiella glycovorans]|uniref:Peroxiredoxin n=1 Tax=Kiritimatiella glycovorans TaxID=1307763 RepID=A0A0G3EL63_9BACT|nr:peroxiredoxin [Kiritimatiella glycovorans]AKJ64869.1 Alkyl hydroperoxide reductase subunit C [Kiritimatiella glycovorans]